jgi:surfeit locus 1 family protein
VPRLSLPAHRVFAPSWGFTLLTVALCALFLALGRWQWHKGNLRQQEWDRFARGTDMVVPLGARHTSALPRFQRVSVQGTLDGAHQFLLDNRSYNGRPGYEVLTPLIRQEGAPVLIDRGWVPFLGIRAQVPDIAVPAMGAVQLTGRIAELPSPGLASGRAPPTGSAWPKLTTFPSTFQLSTALGAELEPRVILLDSNSGPGYTRNWQPPGMEPIRHWSYAVQWWAFAVLQLGLWIGLNLRRTSPVS